MDVATEKEFLEEWEQYHKKPQQEALLAGWYKERDEALGCWLMEREQEEKELLRAKEKESQNKMYGDRLGYEKLTGRKTGDSSYLLGEQPYDEERFEHSVFSKGVELITVLVCLSSLMEIDELAERIFQASKLKEPQNTYEDIWKDMASRHKQDVIDVRCRSQRGQCVEMVDKVQSTLDLMVQNALAPNWKHMNLLHFVGEQMVKTFYTMDDTSNMELRSVRRTFRERDTDSVMQKFLALKRMTEILSVYEKITEKFKDRFARKERLSEQELREFLLGSYVSNELKNSITQKELTKEAMRFGVLHTKVNSAGGMEVTYGDEEVAKELERTPSYQKMKDMTIGEISDMLHRKQEKGKKVPIVMNQGNILEKTFKKT